MAIMQKKIVSVQSGNKMQEFFWLLGGPKSLTSLQSPNSKVISDGDLRISLYMVGFEWKTDVLIEQSIAGGTGVSGRMTLLFRVCRVGLQVFSALYFPILARPWRVEDGLFLGFMWNKQRDSARPRCPLKPLCDSRWTKKSRYSLPSSFCLSWRKMTTRQWRRFSRERQFCTPVTQS